MSPISTYVVKKKIHKNTRSKYSAQHVFFIYLSVDACDGSVTIDDMQWCHNCPGKLWDASGNGGSGSCDDISAECDDLNTVADADHCYACGMRGVEETSWDGTTCAGIDCGKSVLH